MNAEASCRFGCHQHTAIAKPVVARANCVTMDEVGDAQRGKAGLAALRPGRSAGTKTPLVEDIGDLCIDVVIEELVDELDNHRRRFYLLCGGLWIQRRQRFGLAALEAQVDLRDAFLWQFDQRGIFDDVGEQSLAFSVRGCWIIPEFLEVCCHYQQALADRVVEHELILLPAAFSFFSCLGQGSQFIVPFGLEGVGDQSIARIDQHESTLRQIRFELRTLGCAAAQLIGIFLPGFDLSSDIERQLDSGRRDLLGYQGSDGLVDGWPCDGLAVPLTESAMPTVADIPGFLLASRGAVTDTEMPAAPAAHCASLKQSRALARWRPSCQLVSQAIRLEQF